MQLTNKLIYIFSVYTNLMLFKSITKEPSFKGIFKFRMKFRQW